MQWESTRSATIGKGGFTTGAEARLEAVGIEVVGTVDGVPAGSIGPSAGLPTSAINTHDGDPTRIDDAAAGENLSHFLSGLPARLDTLASLLSDRDIAMPANAASADPESLVVELHAWSART